mmetsp:Transcript_6738/g.20406  ORF Transcript_6738/g.20406 Transcript_6738/m.20406 type:complete len:382 (+) Transcript_6738:648-1793(+)
MRTLVVPCGDKCLCHTVALWVVTTRLVRVKQTVIRPLEQLKASKVHDDVIQHVQKECREEAEEKPVSEAATKRLRVSEGCAPVGVIQQSICSANHACVGNTCQPRHSVALRIDVVDDALLIVVRWETDDRSWRVQQVWISEKLYILSRRLTLSEDGPQRVVVPSDSHLGPDEAYLSDLRAVLFLHDVGDLVHEHIRKRGQKSQPKDERCVGLKRLLLILPDHEGLPHDVAQNVAVAEPAPCTYSHQALTLLRVVLQRINDHAHPRKLPLQCLVVVVRHTHRLPWSMARRDSLRFTAAICYCPRERQLRPTVLRHRSKNPVPQPLLGAEHQDIHVCHSDAAYAEHRCPVFLPAANPLSPPPTSLRIQLLPWPDSVETDGKSC